MKDYKLLQVLEVYCKEQAKDLPMYDNRMILYREYEKSLWTAPVEDCEDTFKQFLKYTDWEIMFNTKKKSKCCEVTNCVNNIELAPLPKAVPVDIDFYNEVMYGCKPQQEGITPMRYNDNTAYASASVQSAQSDTSIQRDYLLKRLASADYPKEQELRTLFNLYVNNTPKTYKDMIAIIKAGTYTIDPEVEKVIDAATEDLDEDDYHPNYGPLCGIIWPGPVADRKGFDAATKEKAKQYTAAKDAIMVGDAAAGLAALQAFEAWLPTPATPAN